MDQALADIEAQDKQPFYDELIKKIKAHFKKRYDFDIEDEHLTQGCGEVEVEFDDFDTAQIEKYREDPNVEDVRYENDGRAAYLKVYACISIDDNELEDLNSALEA